MQELSTHMHIHTLEIKTTVLKRNKNTKMQKKNSFSNHIFVALKHGYLHFLKQLKNNKKKTQTQTKKNKNKSNQK